jgi:DNA-binding transcriptional LysR family regulator
VSAPIESTDEFADISFRDVQVFLLLAERRNITAAAKELNLTQSGMSRAIRVVEAAVGVQLFDRTRQGISLTTGGAAFMPYARQLAQSFSDAVASVQARHDQRLTLAVSNIIGPLVLPALLGHIPLDQMADGLALNELPSHQVIAQVATGAADLGLCMCASTARQSEVEAVPLLGASLGLLAGADVRLPHAVPSFAALGHLTRPSKQARLQLARLADDMVLPQALRAHAAQHGVQFDVYFASRLVCNSMPALFSAVASRQWVTLVSAIAAYGAPHNSQFLPLPHLLPPLQLCLVGRPASGWQHRHAAWVAAIGASVRAIAWPDSVTRL